MKKKIGASPRLGNVKGCSAKRVNKDPRTGFIMNETMPFFNHDWFGEIRVVANVEEPLFVASDVAKVLGCRMASDMTRRLDECDKGAHPVRTPSGIQIMTVINESALFEATLGSKIEMGQAFKRLVTHEVLFSIHKTARRRSPATRCPSSRATAITTKWPGLHMQSKGE